MPAVLRAIVACGWFGIQAWIGGQAIYSMLTILAPGLAANFAGTLALLFCVLAVEHRCDLARNRDHQGPRRDRRAIHVGSRIAAAVVDHPASGRSGTRAEHPEQVREHQRVSSILRPEPDRHGRLLGHCCPQHSRFHALCEITTRPGIGQALGLPPAMTIYSFIGVAVTSASVVLFGQAIWDPVALLGPLPSAGCRLDCAGRAAGCNSEYKCGRKRCFAFERFLQSEPAARFLSERAV